MSQMSLSMCFRVARLTPLAGLRNAMISAKLISWLQLPLHRMQGHGRLPLRRMPGPAYLACSR